MRPGSAHGDRGESLLEILLAIAVLGTAVVAIVGGLGGAVLSSDVNRKQSGTLVLSRNLAEYFKDSSATPYVACPSATTSYANYVTTFVASLSDPTSRFYVKDFRATDYSIGAPTVVPATLTTTGTGGSRTSTATFTGTCASTGDSGLQRVTVSINSKNNRATATAVVVKRAD